MDKKKVVILGIGAAVAAVGVYFLYKKLSKKVEYDKFRDVTAGGVEGDFTSTSLAECQAACDSDPNCRGMVFNGDTCRTFSVDPYTNWSNSFGVDTYIKRDADAPASYWSAWDPPMCPGVPGIGDWCGTVVQHRVCTGNCIGDSENHCPTQECPIPPPSGVYENLGSGWDVAPDPNPTIQATDLETGQNAETCKEICDSTSLCRGFWYVNMHGLQKSKCAMIVSDVEGVTKATTPNMYNSNDLYMRVPEGTQWGPLPDVSACTCSTSKLDRPCESESCSGVGYVTCPPKACAYDKFDRVTIN